MPGEGWRMSINVGSGKIALFPSSSANVEDDIYKGAICFQCWCFIFSDFLQRYRNYLSVIYLLKLKVQVITSIHWFTALWLVEMFICQIFLMDYSIWVAKFWGRIYQKLSNNSELKTWQGRKYRILNLPRAFKDTQSSKLLFKVSPPHIILVSSWFVLCPENWVAEHTPTQR